MGFYTTFKVRKAGFEFNVLLKISVEMRFTVFCCWVKKILKKADFGLLL
jgi:hypothetical protein